MLKSKSLITSLAAALGLMSLLVATAPSYAHTDEELQQILEQIRESDEGE